jgi:hypothetical protein
MSPVFALEILIQTISKLIRAVFIVVIEIVLVVQVREQFVPTDVRAEHRARNPCASISQVERIFSLLGTNRTRG